MTEELREKVRRLAEWVKEHGFDMSNYKDSGSERQMQAHADAREILAALDAEPFPRPSVEKGIRSVVATWAEDDGLKVWVEYFDADRELVRFRYEAKKVVDPEEPEGNFAGPEFGLRPGAFSVGNPPTSTLTVAGEIDPAAPACIPSVFRTVKTEEKAPSDDGDRVSSIYMVLAPLSDKRRESVIESVNTLLLIPVKRTPDD